MLEWDEKDVQDFLNANLDYRPITAQFSLLNGDKLAKMDKEDLISISKDDALGRALFNDLQAIKDQEKANANKTNHVASRSKFLFSNFMLKSTQFGGRVMEGHDRLFQRPRIFIRQT